MIDEQIEEIAKEAKNRGMNDLAIVLYCYLGARKAGVSSEFSSYCQEWAKRASDELNRIKNRRNN